MFSYSKIKYVNLQTKVKIGCPNHNPFLKIPLKHIYGAGCPACGIGQRGRSSRLASQREKLHRCTSDQKSYYGFWLGTAAF